jgi:serine/threonine protein kinase
MEHEGYNTDMLAGSVAYMAPELVPLEEDTNVDKLFSHMSDVYAFGILTFEVSQCYS